VFGGPLSQTNIFRSKRRLEYPVTIPYKLIDHAVSIQENGAPST